MYNTNKQIYMLNMKKIVFLLLFAIPTIMLCSCNADDKKGDDDPGVTGKLTVDVKIKSRSSGEVEPVYKRVVSGDYYIMDATDGTPGNGSIYYYKCKFMLFEADNCEYDLESIKSQPMGTIIQKGLRDKAGNYHPNLFVGGLNEGMYRFNTSVETGKYCIMAILEKDNGVVGENNATVGSSYSATIVEVKENKETIVEKIFLEIGSSSGSYDNWENNAQ